MVIFTENSRLFGPHPAIHTPPAANTALLNSPFAKGDTVNTHATFPPEDPPTILTLSGSPPNLAIFRLIHFNAVITSRIPFEPPVPYPAAIFSLNAPNP